MHSVNDGLEAVCVNDHVLDPEVLKMLFPLDVERRVRVMNKIIANDVLQGHLTLSDLVDRIRRDKDRAIDPFGLVSGVNFESSVVLGALESPESSEDHVVDFLLGIYNGLSSAPARGSLKMSSGVFSALLRRVATGIPIDHALDLHEPLAEAHRSSLLSACMQSTSWGQSNYALFDRLLAAQDVSETYVYLLFIMIMARNLSMRRRMGYMRVASKYVRILPMHCSAVHNMLMYVLLSGDVTSCASLCWSMLPKNDGATHLFTTNLMILLLFHMAVAYVGYICAVLVWQMGNTVLYAAVYCAFITVHYSILRSDRAMFYNKAMSACIIGMKLTKMSTTTTTSPM